MFSVGTPQGGNRIIWVHVKPNLVSVLWDDVVSLSKSVCQTLEALSQHPWCVTFTQPTPPLSNGISKMLTHFLSQLCQNPVVN